MWPYPKIIAHRGGGSLAPENTIAAMRSGLRYGFRAVEFDVMLAGDGIPVVVHDPQLGRTVAGRGRVRDYPASTLMQMDAGSWFAPAFANEPVPSYQQVFQFCMEQAIWMNVEIKPSPGCEKSTGRTVAGLTAQWLDDIAAAQVGAGVAPPLLSSFSFEALLMAKEVAPHLALAYLVEKIPADWREHLEALDAVALHTNHKNLSKQQAAAIKKAGYGLFCYTVNDPARARELFSWGVDAFCTDRIDLIGPDFR